MDMIINDRKKLTASVSALKIPVFIIALFIISMLMTENFMTSYNMKNLINTIAIYGTAGLGMSALIVVGDFDLSVGAVAVMAGMIMTRLVEHNVPIGLAVAAALAFGALVGLINAVLVVKLKLNSLIVTMSTMLILQSLALVVSGSVSLKIRHEALQWFGRTKFGVFSVMFIVFLFFMIIAQYVMTQTRFGRGLYAVGGNLEYAKKAGLNGDRYKIAAFVFCSMISVIAGIMITARLMSTSPIASSHMGMELIAASVIGGTSLTGGKGGIIQSVFGLMLLKIFANMIDLMGVSSYWQNGVMGLIIVIIVGEEAYRAYKRNKNK